MNVGTIVEADMLNVRLVRSRQAAPAHRTDRAAGRMLGEVEEYFVETLTPGDTFVFAGEMLRFEALREDECYVSTPPAPKTPKCRPMTVASSRCRPISPTGFAACWPSRSNGRVLPEQCATGCGSSNGGRVLPRGKAICWWRPFRARQRLYMVCYPFEGRLAHQTLGMLLTRRLERAGSQPLGFVANEYALAVWGLDDMALRYQARRAVAGRAVRRGHAGRRPGCLAGRSLR